MGKLKLAPEPTFKASVSIPVPGGDAAEVEFTFKHRTRDDVLKWLETAGEQKEVDSILAVVLGWELDDEFTPENVERLCQNYGGAASAIVSTYLEELRGARTKN